ncbi:hypothetical protein BDZ97DRAFT_1753593 [Flammula alnicola]|nr:hypothetical protein BDZ97DRAFT_1753593 [Flammula alnicola]
MSRAGLGVVSFSLILFFAVCVGLTASAPLPAGLSSLNIRYDYDNDFVARSLATFIDRELDIADDPEYTKRSILNDRELDAEENKYFKCDYDDLSLFDEREFDIDDDEYYKRDGSDLHMLRSRSLWDKIRSGFQRAGNTIRKGFNRVKSGFQKASRTIQSGLQRAGGAIRNRFQKVGGGVSNGFQKVRAGFQKGGGVIRNGFQKAGQGFRTAAGAMKKGFGIAGNAIRKNIGKVAKFGLKVLAAGATMASKVVKFIPGIGTGVSMALKGVAKGANIASKEIHADLGSQLDKASNGLDYVINPMGSVEKLAAGAVGAKGAQALAVAEELILRHFP